MIRAAVLALVVLTASSPVSAATWPSGGCTATLQACINAAPGGAVVEIATNGPISESIEIDDKSVTLRPAAGFAPLFTSFNSITVLGGAAAATVVVEGMSVHRLGALQGGTGTLDVAFRNNSIINPQGSATAIEVSSFNAQYGSVHFDVSGNHVTAEGFVAGDQVSAITIASESGASGKVTGNVLRVDGVSTQSAVIDVANNNQALTVDIVANDIGGHGFNSAISLYQAAPLGSVTTRVVDNLVSGGQVNVGGLSAGIALSDGGGGVVSAIVVNNTVVGGETGIAVTGSPGPGASLVGVLANNIVAGNGFGIWIDGSFAATFSNDHNLVFGNGDNDFTPGPGTLFTNPQFEGSPDFHLQATSPARNAGASARVPADITVDLDGLPRIQETAVDIGAYEIAPPAVEAPALGMWGTGILAATLGAAALAEVRRRSRQACH